MCAPCAKMEGNVFRTNKHFLYAQVSGSATQNILTGQLILLSESDFQTCPEQPDTTVPPWHSENIC